MVIDERFVNEVLQRLEAHRDFLQQVVDRKIEDSRHDRLSAKICGEVTRAQIDVVRHILGEDVEYIQ